jgi:hypothetical protein
MQALLMTAVGPAARLPACGASSSPPGTTDTVPLSSRRCTCAIRCTVEQRHAGLPGDGALEPPSQHSRNLLHMLEPRPGFRKIKAARYTTGNH